MIVKPINNEQTYYEFIIENGAPNVVACVKGNNYWGACVTCRFEMPKICPINPETNSIMSCEDCWNRIYQGEILNKGGWEG